MPTPKNHPQANTGLLQTLRRHRLLLLSGFILLATAGLILGLRVHHARAAAADRTRFIQAEKDIASLSADIIAATGQPLKVTSQKFCSRPNLKFEEGPLSCNIETLHFYAVEDEVQATNIYQKISFLAREKWQFRGAQFSLNLHSDTSFTKIKSADYLYSKDYERISENYTSPMLNLLHRVVYTFYKASAPPYPDYIRSMNTPFFIVIRLGFGDNAKAQYYTVK